MRKLLVASVMAVLAVLLAACSSSGGSHASTGSSTTTSSGGAPTITISSFDYTGSLTVSPGEKVTVINKDSVQHSLTDKVTHKFDTGLIDPGGTGSFTAPTTAGTYPFGCTIHPEMEGTLTVKA